MLKNLIVEFCRSQQRKRIQIKEMLDHITKSQGDVFWRAGGYPRFAEVVTEMVDEGVLKPIKSWKLNGMNPPLYNGYQYMPKSDRPDSTIRHRLLTYYHPKLSVATYLQNTQAYEDDREYLDRLDAYLKNEGIVESSVPRTINERSFEIFQDEKWLASAAGQAFLQRVGITIEDLRCQWTYEPFFYFQPPDREALTDILIVENKDTFFTFKTLIQQGVSVWDDMDISLLIYGEGNKILKSFDYFMEIYHGPLEELRFFYYGDLDPVGIKIWSDLHNKYDHSIKPTVLFYQALFERWGTSAPALRTKQRWNASAVAQFLLFFDPQQRTAIKQLLENHKYLPQEALHGELLQKLAKGGRQSHAVD